MSVSVLIDRAILKQMHDVSTASRPNEAGGLLLGYRKEGCLHLAYATRPYKNDVATPTRFYRRDLEHQRYATARWKESRRLVDWVGEWHSHSERSPKPSQVDLSTWASQSETRADVMVYAIQGLVAASIWMLEPYKGIAVPMVSTDEDSVSVLFESVSAKALSNSVR